ncbi:hypothetical protein NFI96_007930 [Prochilodus magdalenae]|nr:hypothetical protein NFI96_007930 [Prochilodus magdalenae]
MADPLRRSLLAKLRGKKAKKAAAANGSSGGNFKAKVSPPTTTAATADLQSGRAVAAAGAAVELDSTARGGKQGRCSNGGLDSGVVRLVSGLRENGDNSGQRVHGDSRCWDELRRREQLAGGDSIGFGNVSWDRSGLEQPVTLPEAAWRRNGTSESREPGWDGALVLDQGASSVSLRAGTEPAEPVQFNCISGHLLDPDSSVSSGSGLFQFLQANVDDLDLIRTFESSLERDLRMPALQSPTFFPTELEILDPSAGPRLLWDRDGSTRHNSVDSEDEDYYDNEILPFYESGGQNLNGGSGPAQSMTVHFIQTPPSGAVSTEETDRLRTQLNEAYYLLINTMQGMAFDGQAASSSSSRSQDSVRSVCSRSSTQLAESDTCSSGQHSGQQASGSHWALLDLSESCGARFGGSQSRSLQCLDPGSCRPPLRRSVSDSGVRYPAEVSPGELGTLSQGGSVPEHAGMDSTLVACEPVTHEASVHMEENASLPDHPGSVEQGQGEEPHEESQSASTADPVVDTVPVWEPAGERSPPENAEASVSDVHLTEHDCSGSVTSLVCSADSPDVPAHKAGPPVPQQLSQSACTGALGKPPGVTVNKMQEWMHKGRVLSSEMRQRIAGSSLRGPQGQDGQAWPKASGLPASATHAAKPGSAGSAGGPQPGTTAAEGQRSFPDSQSLPLSSSLSSSLFPSLPLFLLVAAFMCCVQVLCLHLSVSDLTLMAEFPGLAEMHSCTMET